MPSETSNAVIAEQDFYHDCFESVREASKEVLENCSKKNEILISDLDSSEDLKDDHWVGSISVNIPAARLYIDTHFTTRVARNLVATPTRLDLEKIPIDVIHDFIREYLNLVMGEIKRGYQSENLELSVPSIFPSYDRGFDLGTEIDLNAEKWKLSWDEGELLMGCYAIAYGDTDLLRLREQGEEEAIEFF